MAVTVSVRKFSLFAFLKYRKAISKFRKCGPKAFIKLFVFSRSSTEYSNLETRLLPVLF